MGSHRERGAAARLHPDRLTPPRVTGSSCTPKTQAALFPGAGPQAHHSSLPCLLSRLPASTSLCAAPPPTAVCSDLTAPTTGTHTPAPLASWLLLGRGLLPQGLCTRSASASQEPPPGTPLPVLFSCLVGPPDTAGCPAARSVADVSPPRSVSSVRTRLSPAAPCEPCIHSQGVMKPLPWPPHSGES